MYQIMLSLSKRLFASSYKRAYQIKPHTFCSACGTSYSNTSWPRTCSCGHIAYQNPLPVAVCVAPILDSDNNIGLLLTRRRIAPYIGGLCFPGGFIEYGENYKDAMVREFREETGFDLLSKINSSSSVTTIAVVSTPDGNRILIFGLLPIILPSTILKKFVPTNETSELVIGGLSDTLCFSIHQEICMNILSGFYANGYGIRE